MSKAKPNVAWPTMSKFVSQLSHDLRNHLNAIELQAALLGEIAPNDEIRDEIKRLRGMTGELGADLQKLSRLMKDPRPQTMAYSARELVEDLQGKVAEKEPELARTMEWRNSLGAEAVEIDPQLMEEALLELFANAVRHERASGPVVFEARENKEAVIFSLREPKKEFAGETESWGMRPLERVSHGHYGLGLHRARSILEAHGGTLTAQFDPAASVLVTTICLPRLVS
jgi:K+-sensing histidine kinase KdpD